MDEQQGSKANRKGKELEEEFERKCSEELGIPCLEYRDWRKSDRQPNVLIKHKPYKPLFGRYGYMEFYLNKADCRIECRSQDVRGSVKEKYPYLVESYVNSPDHPSKMILILKGDAIEDDVKNYINRRIPEVPIFNNVDDCVFFIKTVLEQ